MAEQPCLHHFTGRDTYWHSLNNKNNTAVIYETWYNKENNVLPKKFLLKFLPNESQLERNVRKTATFAKCQSEITSETSRKLEAD